MRTQTRAQRLKDKETVLRRFQYAHRIAGKDWRNLVRKSDPSMDTTEGGADMQRVADDMKTGRRVSDTRLLRVTRALEKALGIEGSPPIV